MTGLSASAQNGIAAVNVIGVDEVGSRVQSDESVVEGEDISSKPSAFALSQNYPNPFNPSTVIRYSVPQTSEVTIRVYDMLGRVVTTLVNERKAEGVYELPFNVQGLASGTYFYRLQAGTFSETKKMLLLK
jgi:hypothetical protein